MYLLSHIFQSSFPQICKLVCSHQLQPLQENMKFDRFLESLFHIPQEFYLNTACKRYSFHTIRVDAVFLRIFYRIIQIFWVLKQFFCSMSHFKMIFYHSFLKIELNLLISWFKL
jgi:hypothetical protein